MQLAIKKCMAAKGCFNVRKNEQFWREINAFPPQFYHKLIKIMLIRENCKFLFVFPRNIPMNVSPRVRFIVKSSSRNGLDILQG